MGRSKRSSSVSDTDSESGSVVDLNSVVDKLKSAETCKRKRVSEKLLASDHTYSKTVDLNQELSDIEEDDEIPILDQLCEIST